MSVVYRAQPVPLIGRSAQLETLTREFDGVSATGARFILVGGEAGAGKTTLVDGFAAAVADRARVVRGECVPMGHEGLAFAPIASTLRSLVTEFGAERVLEWAGPAGSALGAVLPGLSAPAPVGESDRLRLFEALAWVWELASREQPLVVIIEDLHWADESTRHVLRFAARALTDAPVLVVATFRTDELTRRHPLRPFLAEFARLPSSDRIDVPRLDRDEVDEMLSLLLPTPVRHDVVDLIHQRSEGIPYFVEELAGAASAGESDMPDSLRDALIVRVQGLSEEAQKMLRLASTSGNRISHLLLEAVAADNHPDLDRLLRETIDAAVLKADDSGYQFRHALLREAIHEDLLPGEHARLHARFAEALEKAPAQVAGDNKAQAIAHHWFAAHDSSRAFTWAIAAAGDCGYAHHEALQMYERALELWDQVEDPESIAGERQAVLEAAAVVALDAGEPDRAYSLIKQSLAETDIERNPVQSATRLMIMGRLLSTLVKPGAVEALQRAVDLVPADPPSKLRAVMLDRLAISMLMVGDRQAAAETSDHVIAAAQAVGSHSLESSGRNTLGAAWVGLGREAEGLAQLTRAGELAERNTRVLVRYHINMSDALQLSGRHQEAAAVAEGGADVARSLGVDRSLGAMLAGNAAEPLLDLGDWARARKLIDRALELDPPAHHRIHLALLRAKMLVWTGELEAADRALVEFRYLLNEQGRDAPQYLSLLVRSDGDLALARGDGQRAWDLASVLLDGRDYHHSSHLLTALHTAAAGLRRLERRPEPAEVRKVRELTDQVAATTVAEVWRPLILAELDDTDEAWRLAVEAMDSPAGTVHLGAYARWELARRLLLSGDRAAVAPLLADAARAAEKLGARLLMDPIADLRARSGLDRPVADGTPGPTTLTPRERDVLRLVALGRSNGEIGAELFISAKTASVHVSNILAKLSVTSRGEAAAVAHRHGLIDPSLT